MEIHIDNAKFSRTRKITLNKFSNQNHVKYEKKFHLF